MLRRLGHIALAVSLAFSGTVTLATAADAALDRAAHVSAACQYRQHGQHWDCVTPGAYCPKAAHGKAGYAKVTNRKYRCSQYPNGQWRWKRA